MPSIEEQDVVRLRMILRDLGSSLKLRGAAVELGPAADSGPGEPIRGLANRAGVLRMGLDLVAAAVDGEAWLELRADGLVEVDGQRLREGVECHNGVNVHNPRDGATPTVMAISVSEDLEPPLPPTAEGPGLVGLGCFGAFLGAGFLMIVGAITVVGWFV
jgi:hypothetical protein